MRASEKYQIRPVGYRERLTWARQRLEEAVGRWVRSGRQDLALGAAVAGRFRELEAIRALEPEPTGPRNPGLRERPMPPQAPPPLTSRESHGERY